MTTTKLTAFRFTDEDLALLAAIQRHTGVRSRTEALRAAIRGYVRAEGVEVTRVTKKNAAKSKA